MPYLLRHPKSWTSHWECIAPSDIAFPLAPTSKRISALQRQLQGGKSKPPRWQQPSHGKCTAVQWGGILAVVQHRISITWQIPTGNKPVQGGGHSHTYCKLSKNLEQTRHGLVRGPKWEDLSRVGAGKHTGQATGRPIPRPSTNIAWIEWVLKLGLGNWTRIQRIAWGWLERKLHGFILCGMLFDILCRLGTYCRVVPIFYNTTMPAEFLFSWNTFSLLECLSVEANSKMKRLIVHLVFHLRASVRCLKIAAILGCQLLSNYSVIPIVTVFLTANFGYCLFFNTVILQISKRNWKVTSK